MASYHDFLAAKAQSTGDAGFEPVWLPDFHFDFQRAMVEWSLLRGRSAMFEDCGLGKTPQQLVWAENIVRRTNRPVLIVTPLAVSFQTIEEAAKFGIEARRSQDGTVHPGINVTNYERLTRFDPSDFAGMVCDESSILKSFDGTRKTEITEFMRKMEYRLLATATAAPNDFIELGTSSEALGELGYMDMLGRFFKNDTNSIKPTMSRRFEKPGKMFDDSGKWRLKGHAEEPFWRWVCSWSRAIRRPSDLGFSDARFVLPELTEREHLVDTAKIAPGYLFSLPAVGLKEQRDERRRSIQERCEKAASLVANTGESALMWCHLNEEGDLLERLLPDAIQVSGKDSDEAKEEKLLSFSRGKSRVLITKPKIGAWGLNFQHCAHVTSFPSHSFEQYYQGVRRCWRFGQTRPVHVDIITTEGEQQVLANLQRKAAQADKMFSNLVAQMNRAQKIDRAKYGVQQTGVPSWL